jgi:putative hemolysin
MTTYLVAFAILSLLIFINALYVAAEFSSVSSRKTRVSHMAGSGNRLAATLLPILESGPSLDRYVAACQLGITSSSLVLGAYGQSVVAQWLVEPIDRFLLWLEPLTDSLHLTSGGVTEALATTIAVTGTLLFLTLLQVIFGELFPKSVAIQYPERLALATVLPVRWSMALFRPFIWLFNGSGNLILRLLGVELHPSHSRAHSPEEIEILVSESHEGGLLDDEERQLLRNAFRYRDLTARQVMVHRTKIVAAPVNSSVVELMEIALEAGHTRIPLYQDSIDSIIGFVHVKDLFRLYIDKNENLLEIMREVLHVPETLPVAEVWEALANRRQYIAVVFDEYGGTAGLITFEDLIEEIFGEVQDEFDDESALIALDSEGRIYLRGDLLVSDVNEYLELNLPDTSDTLSGLVLSELGRLPQEGDEIALGGTAIRVEKMEDRAVAEVSLQAVSAEVSTQVGEWEVGDHE